MSLKNHNNRQTCAVLPLAVLLFQLCFIFGFALTSSAQSTYNKNPSGDAETLNTQTLSKSAPTNTSYDDFLKNLGIKQKNGGPKNLLDDDFEVTLRFLDRPIGTTSDITLHPNDSKMFQDRFIISVRACIKEHNNIPGNDAAFVVIRTPGGELMFRGWMLKLFPGAAALEHKNYDALMRDCKDLTN